MRFSRDAFRAVLLVTVGTAALAATSDPVYQALRQAAITETFVVDNIVLKRDIGTLTLKSGSIGFTPQAMGRDTVAVFVGEGEFTLAPAMQLEKTYLKTLTEQDSVKESFDRALLYFTDDAGKEIRGQAKTKAETAKLAEILSDFRKRMRRESDYNLETALLADLYHPGQPGFFSAYIHGRKHSEMQFHLKPRGAEPSLGPEEVMLLNVQPANVPDEIWYHAHLQDEFTKQTASSEENRSAVQAESYKIDTTIARNDHFAATTTLRLKARLAGDRVIPMSLLPTLRVSKVTADGQEAAFIQEDKKDDAGLSVILAQPLEKGGTHEIVIEYQGDKVVRKEGGGNFAVGARESWYPNVNTFHDHALYDLTFRVPKQYTLVSVGKLEKEWTEKDAACSHWISGSPLAVAGFNYGTFKKKVTNDTAVGAIEGYATSEVPDYLAGASDAVGAMGKISAASLMDRTMVEAQNALRIFSAWFGKSEFERIAITQQPEFDFGQSWPSLVYLPMSAFLDSTQRFRLLQAMSGDPRFTAGMNQFVDEVTAHEVSHQWWGHMVGWSTYHDQWLSEGFADFSAGLYLQLTEKSPEKYLKYWEHARQSLVEKNAYGRRANDAGPIWLGRRLATEKNGGAYQRVVYDKGGFVLHMLRQMMFDPRNGGDRQFIETMQDFVRQMMNRNATTERFQQVVEKHMTPAMNAAGDGKMDWFFGEWVFGTWLPKYKLDYTLTAQDDGKTLLKGSITQSEVPPGFIMQVPIYMDIDGGVARLGSARMVGSTTVPLEVALPKKPKRVMLNYYHDVLEQ
jgi:hypothetical protein